MAKKTILHTQKFKFKKGDKHHLDEIYSIQGLAESAGRWWEFTSGIEYETTDEVIITRNVEFKIIEYKTI